MRARCRAPAGPAALRSLADRLARAPQPHFAADRAEISSPVEVEHHRDRQSDDVQVVALDPPNERRRRGPGSRNRRRGRPFPVREIPRRSAPRRAARNVTSRDVVAAEDLPSRDRARPLNRVGAAREAPQGRAGVRFVGRLAQDLEPSVATIVSTPSTTTERRLGRRRPAPCAGRSPARPHAGRRRRAPRRPARRTSKRSPI